MPLHAENYSQGLSQKGFQERGTQGDGPPYPHGYAYCAVHVAFVQPPVLGDPTLLRAQGGGVLGERENHS